MPKNKRNPQAGIQQGFHLPRWQLDILKELAIEHDRNLSSVLRRLLSESFIRLGRHETVAKYDHAYTTSLSLVEESTDVESVEQ